MVKAPVLIVAAAACLAGRGILASYIPPYIEGDPLTMTVTAIDPPDIREEPVYRIEFTVLDSSSQVVPGLVHRTYEEFVTFDEKAEIPDIILPPEELATVDSINQYLNDAASRPDILSSTLMWDFLGINWSGQDCGYINNLEGFMDMLLFYRVPKFMPEPVVIDNLDDVFLPEAPFEAYVFIQSFRHNKLHTQEFLDFFKAYTDSTPAFDGPDDQDSDVWAPGQTAALDYPYHYNKTYVHFMPGGYINGHTVRLNYVSWNKFSFLNQSRIREWLEKLYPDISPKTLLDVGTGNCHSALVMAEMFPDAEVYGIDMAAPYIRFCRQWAARKGLTNVQFFQGSGEDMPFFATDYFDFVNYAYVLHEMPGENARRVVSEMHRVLKPGGLLNGFEVPSIDDPFMAGFYAFFNTWGFPWDSDGMHGPEPYIEEYQFITKLPHALEEIGFEAVEVVPYSFFESIFKAKKPLANSRA